MIGQRQARRSNDTRGNRRSLLRLLQVNVGTSGSAHDVALNLGWEAKADIILVQEPYARVKGHRHLSKSHPGYHVQNPMEDWTEKPGVMTYVRKDPTLQAYQVRPVLHRDIIITVVNGTTIANVYRRPRSDAVLDLLEEWRVPHNTVIAGDFNSVHWTWQPGHSRHAGRGDRLATWAENHTLRVCNPEQPTHIQGNTIDLVFTNIPGVTTQVAEKHYTGSDHFTLWTTIPTGPPPLPPKQMPRVRLEQIPDFWQLIKQNSWLLPEKADTETECETLAGAISDLLRDALYAVGKTPHCGGFKTSWWSEECRKKHKELRTARGKGWAEESALLRKELHTLTRKAKRDYWEERISNATKDKDIFGITAWHKLADAYASPPLMDGDSPVTLPKEKATFLRDKVLYRFSAEDDIRDPWSALEGNPARIPWDEQVTLEEARVNCILTGNTAPGQDGITVDLLTVAWESIGPNVRTLYEGCLRTGYHPKVFKTAEVTMIPKVGKTDYTSYRSYRPIALLSCIGKGLERLVAKRMSTLSLLHKVLAPQHFGALPRRSATDLTNCVTHDIEEALEAGQEASLLTMDVQGAFDAALRNRLALRLREQGWPDSLVRWVLSFMSERQAAVRLEGVLTDNKDLTCGIPQGSPVSPILYMLYLEPLVKRGDSSLRFAYADDFALLRIGKNTRDTTRALSRDLADTLEWGRNNAVSFDPGKSELIHFSRSRKLAQLKVKTGDFEVSPSTDPVRWLGVYFDTKLTFRPHVETWGAKAHKIAAHLRCLNRVTQGTPPRATAKAAAACVLPTALFASEVWWQGKTKPGTKDKTREVSTRMEHHVGVIDKAIRSAARAVLPVWKTTPGAALHRESGLPPAEVALEQTRHRTGLRFRLLDEAHPIVTRLRAARKQKGPGGRPGKNPSAPRTTRLQRTELLSTPCHRPQLISRNFPEDAQPLHRTRGKSKGKDEHATLLKEWVRPTDVLIYSDGSQTKHGTGWAFVAYQNAKPIYSRFGPLGKAEVFDAEIKGAAEAATWVAANQRHVNPSHVFFFLDNTSVIQGILGNTPDSSQHEFLRFRHNARKLHPTQFSVWWTPGHVGIEGNEEADRLAKQGTEEHLAYNELATVSHARRLNRATRQDIFDSWWTASHPDKYQKLGLTAKQRPPELALPRGILARYLAERTGHGDFVSYHHRFRHDHEGRPCRCGAKREPGHFTECPLVNRWALRGRSPGRARRELLGEGGWFEFQKLVEESRVYDPPSRGTTPDSD